MLDLYKREIDYVRLSVTDRCNLKCIYCMSEQECMFDNSKILAFGEFKKILKVLSQLGINKIKITGGEPLLRPGIIDFISDLKNDNSFKEVTITTNGLLLDRFWDELRELKIDGINISLDSLNEKKYETITRGGNLKTLIKNIDNILNDGYENLKINMVPIKNLNQEEILDFAELASNLNLSVRFIELMPIGEANKFMGLTRDDIIKKLINKYGEYEKTSSHGNGPAKYITFNGFKGNIGFIDAVNHKFCSECNRIRIDSLGNIILCLHHHKKISSLDFVNGKISEEKFLKLIEEGIYYKPKENTFITDKEIDTNMNKIGG